MKRTLRFWEIDLLRALAVTGMVFYHLSFDLFYLKIGSLDPFSPPFIVLARVIAVTFLFLVGFSFSLSLERYPMRDFSTLFKTNFIRATKILLAASLVTLATFLISPDFTVRFGILHLIAFSLLLLFLFSLFKNRLILLPLSLVLIVAGLLLGPQSSSPTFDYYPLVPWFGVVLLGFVLAKNYSSKRTALFAKQPAFLIPLSALGQHSLIIYLLHQPILFGLLFLFKNQLH